MSRTELIRRAVRLLREQSGRERPNLDDLLDSTSGSFKLCDGLTYQRKVRHEARRHEFVVVPYELRG